MAKLQSIAVEPRERAGKGAARAVRREGRVPGVIYGAKQPPELVVLARGELNKALQRGNFLSSVFEVELDGRKQQVLPRDVQFHPVSDQPVHVDFLRLTEGATVVLDIPVHFTNHAASPGLKRGGVLNVVRHAVEFECPVEAIPEAIEISLEGMEINDSIHISAVALPKGVKPTIARDFTIATVVAPSGVKSEAQEAAASEAAVAEAPAEGAASAAPKETAKK
ncbi:MAG: 50S ribosomal protein L25/general stress protein Ctc [Pseudomonadota bacterium]|jgi:large subunit ribosomal protein L25